MLGLAHGETVLDVACGTGLSLPLLRQAVGPDGRVLGVEMSPDMMSRARERVARAGWSNVTLLEAPMEEADLAAKFDARCFVERLVRRWRGRIDGVFSNNDSVAR